MNLKFVVSHLDQQLGPFTEAELKAKWAKGELFPIDYVYDELKKDWILLAERFDWARREEGAPPPLKPSTEKKKLPPAAPKAAVEAARPTPKMTQQKPALETALIIQAPLLSVPNLPGPLANFEDPLPTPTSLPVMPPPSTPKATQVNMVNGLGEISLSPDLPGQVELVLSGDTPLKLEPLKIQIRPVDPEELVWSFSAEPVVGHPFEIEVKAVDGRGHVCPHFSAECSIETKGSETRQHHLNLKEGRGVILIENTKAEKWEMKLRYGGAKHLRFQDQKTVDWQPGPAARLVLEGPPDIHAGVPLKVQVRAVDQYGNLAKTFSGTVVLDIKAS